MGEKRLESQRSQVDNRRFKWGSKTLWGYGVGHVQSDLVATMWFAYLLVFLEKVIGLPPIYAGYLLTIGQLTDGIATPLVGLGLDKAGVCGKKYGQRKSWHLLGTMLITISFPFLYSAPPGYERELGNWSHKEMLLYYTPFVVIFQIAWASAQVSHLSLIPCLTCKDSARVQLTSLRNGFTLLSSIVVYICTYVLFATSTKTPEILPESANVTSPEVVGIRNCTIQVEVDQVGWDDRKVYSTLALGAVILGAVFQGFIFHFFVHEPNNDCCANEEDDELKGLDESSSDPSYVTHSIHGSNILTDSRSEFRKSDGVHFEVDNWVDWFKCPLFYMVALQYCLTRLIVNITASYMPYYLQEALDLPKEYIATIPLIQFITGFAVSFTMKPLSKQFGKNGMYFLGCIVMIAGAIWATLLEYDQVFGIYFLGVLFGAGTSTILVQSLAMTAELIGENSTSAAFVYGAMSLTDKLACGGAIMAVQYLSPCNDEMVPNGPCEENGCGLFYCRVMGYGIGIITVLAILSNLLHWHHSRKR